MHLTLNTGLLFALYDSKHTSLDGVSCSGIRLHTDVSGIRPCVLARRTAMLDDKRYVELTVLTLNNYLLTTDGDRFQTDIPRQYRI